MIYRRRPQFGDRPVPIRHYQSFSLRDPSQITAQVLT